jgi:hypothetical protein
MAMSPFQAFLISFALGFVIGFSFISLGLGWLSFFGLGRLVLELQLTLGVIVGVVFGGFGLGFYYLGRALGRKGLLAVAALLFVLGLVLVQPEVDALAVLPAAFALVGTGRRRG